LLKIRPDNTVSSLRAPQLGIAIRSSVSQCVRSKVAPLYVRLAISFGFGIAMLLASLLAVPLERPGIIELLLAPVVLVFSVIPESAMQRRLVSPGAAQAPAL